MARARLYSEASSGKSAGSGKRRSSQLLHRAHMRAGHQRDALVLHVLQVERPARLLVEVRAREVEQLHLGHRFPPWESLQSRALLYGHQHIMAAADLTRGGFYAHFRSKTDLFAEVLGQESDFVRRLRAARGVPRSSLHRNRGDRRTANLVAP